MRAARVLRLQTLSWEGRPHIREELMVYHRGVDGPLFISSDYPQKILAVNLEFLPSHTGAEE